MVTGRSTILNSFSNQSILYGYDVIGAASSTSGNPTEHLGYAYVVKGTLADVDGRPASASLTLINHDNTYCAKGIGIKNLLELKKYEIDILGNYHEVKIPQKRMEFNLNYKHKS